MNFYHSNSKSDIFLKRQSVATFAITVLSLIIFIVFATINILQQEYFLMTVDVVAIIFIGFTFKELIKKQNTGQIAFIMSIIMLIITLVIAYYDKNQTYGLIWVSAYPILSISMLGNKKSFLLNLILMLIIFPMAYMGIDEWNYGNWNTISFIRFSTSFVFVLFLLYLLEFYFLSMNQELKKSREKELKYIDELQKISSTDSLTSLYNRRYFDSQFSIYIDEVKRYEKSCCIILLDIDFFKSVNDTYGHDEGDVVLKKIAQIIDDNCRSSDISARWGGEEFIILLKETTVKDAFSIADGLRISISENEHLESKGITASFGVSCFDTELDTPKKIFKRVDEALYTSKENGRNKVTIK